MEVKVFPLLLMRNPAFSHTICHGDRLKEFCAIQQFKDAIFIASPVLYAELQKKSFNPEQADKKLRQSAYRYFNRMCFRPTPFGLFSSFSVVPVTTEPEPIVLQETLLAQLEPARTTDLAISGELLKAAGATSYYQVNATIYSNGGEYRYYSSCPVPESTRLEFVLSSLDSTRVLDSVLAFCSRMRQRQDVIRVIAAYASCEMSEAEQYFEALLEKQVLVNSAGPGITGNSETQRLLEHCMNNGLENDQRVIMAKELLGSFSATCPGVAERAAGINRRLSDLCHDRQPGANLFYAGLRRRVSGGFSSSKLQELLDAVRCLDKLSGGISEPPSLEKFISDFKRRFEDSSVPLLLALDHQLGAGYGSSYSAIESDDVLETVVFAKNGPGDTRIAWTPAHRLLLRLWNELPSGTRHDGIEITEDDLLEIGDTGPSTYAPGFPVMFRVAGEQLLIEQAGGVSAVSLIGRFTLFSEEVDELARELVRIEEEANPDVIFAEIVHVCDSHADNINRRTGFRRYELPVLCSSEKSAEYQVLPGELMVKIEREQVILYSSRLNKRIIPRLSTAYNYSRNDLPLFRFLCDLQSQGLRSHYNLLPEQLFPGLRYYPRIRFRKVVLSLASWHLDSKQIRELLKAGEHSIASLVAGPLKKLGLPAFFSLTEYDNQLVFDRGRETDLQLFLESLKNKTSVIIKEFLPDDPGLVRDSSGAPFVNQFIASLYHSKTVYKGLSTRKDQQQTRRRFAPGSDWLYIKIYCHASRSNSLIERHFNKVITRLPAHATWFFIRFADPGHHIRLRIKTGDREVGATLTMIESIFSAELQSGEIERLQVDTYQRELERYGDGRIVLMESIFHASSRMVIPFICRAAKNRLVHSYFSFALRSLNSILDKLFDSEDERLDFVRIGRDAFLREYDHPDRLLYQLDLKYRKLRQEISLAMADECYFSALKLAKVTNELMRKAGQLRKDSEHMNRNEREKLYFDLVHMHLNRIFEISPREQELATYHLLFKYLLSASKRKKTANQAKADAY